MYIQLSMQIALEETVRGASKTAYISSIYANLSKEENYKVWKELYEKVYQIPLKYGE